MLEEIFIKKNQNDFSTVNTTGYTMVYINTTNAAKTTQICLSKYKGDILYILSRKDYLNYKDFFSLSNKVITKENKPALVNVTKRSKQSNLFSFIKKK